MQILQMLIFLVYTNANLMLIFLVYTKKITIRIAVTQTKHLKESKNQQTKN